MEQYIIKGGHPLVGEVEIGRSKECRPGDSCRSNNDR